jgi:hypothetical protein
MLGTHGAVGRAGNRTSPVCSGSPGVGDTCDARLPHRTCNTLGKGHHSDVCVRPVLLLWVGIGFVERIVTGIRAVGLSAQAACGDTGAPGSWVWPALIFVALLIVAISFRSWWKPMAALLVALGIGILLWAMAATSRGLWMTNPHYTTNPPQSEWHIILGALLSAAPAVVIGWRIGRISTGRKQIWFSGLAGVWLPLALSVTAASLADEAGARLYWRPSLFRGFSWALLGPGGQSLGQAMAWAGWTLLGPALVGVISIRMLCAGWPGRKTSYLALLCVVSTAYVIGVGAWAPTPLHELALPAYKSWAACTVALAAAAGLIVSIRSRFRRDQAA